MICFDTNIVIWGVQGFARKSQIGMIDRAQRYIRHLSDAGERVMLPAIVVNEYLRGVEPSRVAREVAALNSGFIVQAFDLPAAVMAAQLDTSEAVREWMREGAFEKLAMRADVQIVATALVHGASRIVTHNVKEFKRIANGKIEVIDLPSLPEQRPLF